MICSVFIKKINKQVTKLLLPHETVAINITPNTPTKPREFVFTNFMLKLCGLFYARHFKKNSEGVMTNVNKTIDNTLFTLNIFEIWQEHQFFQKGKK